ACSARLISGAWLLGGVQMSTKSSVLSDSRSSTPACQRPPGQASRKALPCAATASVAATISTPLTACQPGRCPFAATLPNPIKPPRSTRRRPSVQPELARDGAEGLVKNVDAAQRLVLGDHQRRIDANDMRIRHRDKAARQRLMEKRERNLLVQRLLGLAIGHHLDADHQAAPAHVTDETIFLLQFFQRIEHHRADAGGIFDELVVDDGLDRTEAGGCRQGVAAIAGRAAARLS